MGVCHRCDTILFSIGLLFVLAAHLPATHLRGVDSVSRTYFPGLVPDADSFALPDSHASDASGLELQGQEGEVPVPTDRLSGFRTSSADFERSFQYLYQAPGKEAKHLLSLQKNECPTVYWGKKELVSRIGKNILMSAYHLMCRESRFRYESRPRTMTWRQCARSASSPWQFFSWVKKTGDQGGACTVLKSVDGSVSDQDLEDCLKEASSNEIAITGAVGDHSSCTSCQVGDWTDVACDSWCNDGLKGRYRRITAHASADHCEAQSDSNCDLCPKLWDVQPCNTDTSCAAGIRPGVRTCAAASEQRVEQAKTWQECRDLCMEGFLNSGGAIFDPGTFYKAGCFRYVFNNETLSCVFNPLHSCSETDSVKDPVWISGDVLSQPPANYTTVTWGEWQEWSSCEMVDPAEGWRKRTRGIKKWGFRGDNEWHSPDWIMAEPCSSNTTLSKNHLDFAMNPIRMCAVYGDFAEWASVPCIPSCGAHRKKTRRRKVLQMPVKQPDGRFLGSCGAPEAVMQASEQTKDCPGFVACTGGCVYSEWTSWSDCRCTADQSGSARQLRARSVLEGDATTCTDLEQKQKCEKTGCERQTSVYYVGAGVGVAVLALVGALVYKLSGSVPAAAPQSDHM